MRKVIHTENYVNKCECGSVVTMKAFRGFNEAEEKNNGEFLYISICPNEKCENVFIALNEKND